MIILKFNSKEIIAEEGLEGDHRKYSVLLNKSIRDSDFESRYGRAADHIDRARSIFSRNTANITLIILS